MHGPPKRYSPIAPAPRRLACVWLGLALAGCASTAPTPRGEVKGAAAAPGELAQSDANRMATLAMRENLEGLLRIADKLYRRNPAEWRKDQGRSPVR